MGSMTAINIDYYTNDAGDENISFIQENRQIIVSFALCFGIFCPLMSCTLCFWRICSKKIDKKYEKRQSTTRGKLNKRMPKWSFNSVASSLAPRSVRSTSDRTNISSDINMVITPSLAEKRFIQKNGIQTEKDIEVVSEFDTLDHHSPLSPDRVSNQKLVYPKATTP